MKIYDFEFKTNRQNTQNTKKQKSCFFKRIGRKCRLYKSVMNIINPELLEPCQQWELTFLSIVV